MQEKTVNSSGGFVFWTCATWSSQEKLAENLKAIGLEGYAPRPMAKEVALREALEVVMNGNKRARSMGRLVRPLSESAGFCVLEETRGKEENQYAQILMARISDNKITLKPFVQEQAQKIASEYVAHRGYVSGSDVGSSLVSLVKKMSGIAIRQTGGLYWLPAKHTDQWRQIAQAIEPCAVFGHTKIYLATMEVTADSIRVVRDAIRREITQEAGRIMNEIQTGELGKKAIMARLAYIHELEGKVKEYEAIVGESLIDLRTSLSHCVLASGSASFQALLPEEAE